LPLENDLQELLYFARDFWRDCFGRFFSCSDSGGFSTGRKWQILDWFRESPD
jgi:hypothetical protein